MLVKLKIILKRKNSRKIQKKCYCFWCRHWWLILTAYLAFTSKVIVFELIRHHSQVSKPMKIRIALGVSHQTSLQKHAEYFMNGGTFEWG